MKGTRKLFNNDLGRHEVSDLVDQIEVILTRQQHKLLTRYFNALVDSRPGFRSLLRVLILHLRVLITSPRLFYLMEYCDIENFDLVQAEALDGNKVQLTLFV